MVRYESSQLFKLSALPSGCDELASGDPFSCSNGLLITFDNYSGNVGGADVSDPGIYFLNNNVVVAGTNYMGQTSWTKFYSSSGTSYIQVQINYEQSTTNTWVLHVIGYAALSESDSQVSNYTTSSNTYWGFVAVTGGGPPTFSSKKCPRFQRILVKRPPPPVRANLHQLLFQPLPDH